MVYLALSYMHLGKTSLYRCAHHVFLGHLLVGVKGTGHVELEHLPWLWLGVCIIGVEQIVNLVEAKCPVYVSQLINLLAVYNWVL